jgi:isoquinoline 1-oxidoreductase subunit beta
MRLRRREFLKTTAAVSGGLVIGLQLPGCDKRESRATGETRIVQTNAWVRIGTDDSVTILVDRSEMGQGVYTALPMLLAEELGVRMNRVKVEAAPADAAYTNNLLGGQITGGSTSVRDAWTKLRTAGAQARRMLVTAAAKEWGIPISGIRVQDGVITSPRGKKLTFGQVAEAASKLPVPQDVQLKSPASFRIIGRDQTRLDTPSKVDGSAVFGIDVKLPGMLYAALAQSPVLGGKVKSFDAEAAKTMPGVREVVETSSGVAVVADSWWQARKARDALKVQWDPGRNASLNDGVISRGLRRAASQKGKVAKVSGNVDEWLNSGARIVQQSYELPLLAHATLEPQNCTADVKADGVDLHVPTQVQMIARAAAARAAGVPEDKVRVHTTLLGGGFGRRLEVDFIPAAVEASKAVGKPVKVVWTREDDMTHDAYRPPAYHTVAAALDRTDNKLMAWKHHIVSPSITARMFPDAVKDPKTVDPFAVEAASNYPYDVPNVLVDYVQHEIGIDVGYWRSVSHALNCFVVESFMDELAHFVKQDPFEFRMALLEKQPRHKGVLRLAGREGNYGGPKKGHYQGVAVMEGYGTYMAMIAEIDMQQGMPRVHKVTCAIDCGQMVNPDTVVAQVESSVLFGLSAAMWGEINIQGGRVQQTNFNNYRIARLTEAPVIDVHPIESGEEPGGVGEPATALIAPALCNAIVMAGGRRLRSLPIARHYRA